MWWSELKLQSKRKTTVMEQERRTLFYPSWCDLHVWYLLKRLGLHLWLIIKPLIQHERGADKRRPWTFLAGCSEIEIIAIGDVQWMSSKEKVLRKNTFCDPHYVLNPRCFTFFPFWSEPHCAQKMHLLHSWCAHHRDTKQQKHPFRCAEIQNLPQLCTEV